MRDTATMRGYGPTSYGDGFAEVYDDWYADVTDVDATVARMCSLMTAVTDRPATLLELGVGTGRLALPLAAAGVAVTGVDSSSAMLDRLHERDAEHRVVTVTGDMVADLPPGPFDAALVAYNTLFNLLDDGAQAACFEAIAARLRPGGVFVVEAFVPDPEPTSTAVPAATSANPFGPGEVTVKSIAVDRVVLSVSQHSPDGQRASGQFIELSEAGGVRLRPWAVRWSTVEQLDTMAAAAGFEVAHRWASMAGDTFDDSSAEHVTVYRLPGG